MSDRSNSPCSSVLTLLLLLVLLCGFGACQRTINVKYSIQTLIGTGSISFNGDGLIGNITSIYQPIGLFNDESSGDLYFSDTYNHRVRVLRRRNGLVETVAGNGTQGYSGEGIKATDSMLSRPFGLFVTMKTKDIYIAGNVANRIHKVSSADGKMYTFAGTGIAGFNGDGLMANVSRFYQPLDIKIVNQDDPSSIQYIVADTYGNRIRSIDSNMMTKTIVGTGSNEYNGDGLAPLVTNIYMPIWIQMRANNTELYFSSLSVNLLRKYDTVANTVTTVSGIVGNSTHFGDGGLAKFASFNNINGLAFSPVNGDLFVCETNYGAIRKISKTTGVITTIAGTGTSGYNGDNSQDATLSHLRSPRSIVSTNNGELIFTDTDNNRIRKLTPVCPYGYVMDELQTNCTETCFGIVYNSVSVCESKGICVSIDKCNCDSGYYGLDCSIPICLTSIDQLTGKCLNNSNSNSQIVQVENVETSQLSNKSLSISRQNTTENTAHVIIVEFPSDFSNYIANQTLTNSLSLLSAISKGTTDITISNTTTYSIVSDVVTISLATTNGNKIKVSNLAQPIQITFNKPTLVTGNLTCMYFDENNNEWKSDGIQTRIELSSVQCLTSHLTSFSIIDINFKKATQKPNTASSSSNPITNSQGLSQEAIIAISVSIAGSLVVCCVLSILILVTVCIIKKKNKK